MKILTLFIASSLFIMLTSCKKEECGSDKGIEGKWRLVAELMDPGDGSGTFHPVNSDKEVKFFDNGTFEANGDMCGMSSQSGNTQTGTYDTSTSTFSPNYCMSMAPLSYHYTVSGNTLILIYPCTCGCRQKYERL